MMHLVKSMNYKDNSMTVKVKIVRAPFFFPDIQ